MHILIVNDDGWGTPGIRMLTEEMCRMGRVTVVAPDSARSGHGACITVGKPLYVTEVKDHGIAGATVYTTNGTPADCVKLALEVVCPQDPFDLMVSGINHGNNCSVNVLYSGTMGACFVACEHGIPAIGYSIDSHLMEVELQHLRPYIVETAKHLMDEEWLERTCYNINAPVGEIQGVRWTRGCRGNWHKEMAETTDEQGRKCWTLAGEYVNHEPQAEDTDIWAVEHGYLSIQPVSIDMTQYGAL